MGLDFLVCATYGLSVSNTVGLDVDLSVSSGFGSGFDSGVNYLFRFYIGIFSLYFSLSTSSTVKIKTLCAYFLKI